MHRKSRRTGAIVAEVEVPKGCAEGVILTSGGRFDGYGVYLEKRKPVFLGNLVDLKRIRREGPKLAAGKHTLAWTGVNGEDDAPPFLLTATLDKRGVTVNMPQLSPEDVQKLEAAQAQAVDGKPLQRVQLGPH